MMAWSLYTEITRAEWARLRADTTLTLRPEDLLRLQGLNERVAMEEVVDIYLPLARLLHLYVEAEQVLYRARATFLGDATAKVPYVIGLAGSVPPVCGVVGRGGRAAGWRDLGRDQRPKPPREHPADTRAGAPRPGQGRGPRCRQNSDAQALAQHSRAALSR